MSSSKTTKPTTSLKRPNLKVPTFSETDDGVWTFDQENAEALYAMFNSPKSGAFVFAMAHACANISGRATCNKEDKNQALSIVAEIGPRDGIEAMLATQMAAVHLASVRHSRQMAGAETIEQLDAHQKVFTKLMRTFTQQMEALRKHRNGGKQKVTVEHVHVHEGGQAVVGNVSTSGGELQK